MRLVSLLLLGFIAFSLPVYAQTPLPPVRPTAKIEFAAQFQASDARLRQPVPSVLLPRTTLWDFFGYLSRNTRVHFDMPSGLGREGYAEIFVSLRGKTPTLAQVMDALASILSYQKAEWRWKQVPAGDNSFNYKLQPAQNFPQIADEVSKQIQSEFEAHCEAMQAALELNPAQLREVQKSNPNIAYINGKNKAANEESRYALQTFFAVMTPAKQQEVLRGRSAVINIDLLPNVGKKFVAAMLASTGDKRSMKYLFFENLHAGKVGVSPSLVLSLAGDQGSISKSYLGGPPMEKVWHERLYSLWLTEEDTGDNPVTEKQRMLPLPAAASQPALLRRPHDDALPLALYPVSESLPVSMIATLNSSSRYHANYYSNTLQNKTSLLNALTNTATVGIFLEKLQSAPVKRMAHKWRGDILLLRDNVEPFSLSPAPTYLTGTIVLPDKPSNR